MSSTLAPRRVHRRGWSAAATFALVVAGVSTVEARESADGSMSMFRANWACEPPGHKDLRAYAEAVCAGVPFDLPIA